MRFVLLLTLFTVFSFPALGQQPAGIRAGIFLAPPYPPDGKIPAHQKSHFVFLDPDNVFNLVVSYPETLGTADFNPDIPVPHKVLRIRSRKHVRPAISVQITKNAQGDYLYQYTVENQLGATQEISVVHLPATVTADGVVSLPQSWISSKTGQIGPAQTSFSAQAGQNLIQPGSRLSGFTVSSKYKPGFALAFLQGPAASDFSIEGLPLPVVDQLKPFQALERDSQAEWVIVPLYHPDTNLSAMVGDFYGGIEAYINHQRLDPSSTFTQELLSVLRKYGDAAEAAGDTPVDEFVGPSLELKQKPAVGLESEIYSALKLSLDLK